MRNVLVLNQFALPLDQGGGTRHAELFDNLDGWTARIMAGNRNHYSQQQFTTADARFDLIAIPVQGGAPAQRLKSWFRYAARAIVRSFQSKHLHLVYASSPHLFTPLAGVVIARLRRVPLIVEIRDLWPESIVAAGAISRGGKVHRLLSQLEKYVLAAADHIVAVTPGWQDHFASLGIDDSRVTVIPNGTDPWNPNGYERSAVRKDLGLTGFSAIFAGAHGPKDGLDFILEAAHELPEAKFVLMGSGTAKPAAMAKAQSANLSNVEFWDSVPKSSLMRILAAFDVGIHSVSKLSVFEQGMSPNKIFDYVAAGIPAVSNCKSGLRDVFPDDRSVVLGDSESLADSISLVMQMDTNTKLSRVKAGKDVLDSSYSRARSRRKLLGTISDVTDRYESRKHARKNRRLLKFRHGGQ